MAWITAPLNAGPISGNSFDYTIPGLSANTIYEYRAYMIVSGVEYTGQTYQINTLPPTQVPPTVITGTASIVDSYNVSINSNNLVSGGTKPIIERGIVWSVSPNPTMPADVLYSNSDGLTTLGTYSLFMSNIDFPTLNPNTTYYVRAYACSSNINGSLIAHGSQIVVQTPPLPAKHVNFVCYGGGGADGGYSSCKNLCISNTTITPAMSPGECFCICIAMPLFVDMDLVNDGISCATYCLYCNNVLYWGDPPPSFCDLYTQVCSPDTNSCKNFIFRYGDVIKLLHKACSSSSNYGQGGTNSCACIRGITSISGSFDIGTTCCKSCAYSG